MRRLILRAFRQSNGLVIRALVSVSWSVPLRALIGQGKGAHLSRLGCCLPKLTGRVTRLRVRASGSVVTPTPAPVPGGARTCCVHAWVRWRGQSAAIAVRFAFGIASVRSRPGHPEPQTCTGRRRQRWGRRWPKSGPPSPSTPKRKSVAVLGGTAPRSLTG